MLCWGCLVVDQSRGAFQLVAVETEDSELEEVGMGDEVQMGMVEAEFVVAECCCLLPMTGFPELAGSQPARFFVDQQRE
jgi:hypothetical protein